MSKLRSLPRSGEDSAAREAVGPKNPKRKCHQRSRHTCLKYCSAVRLRRQEDRAGLVQEDHSSRGRSNGTKREALEVSSTFPFEALLGCTVANPARRRAYGAPQRTHSGLDAQQAQLDPRKRSECDKLQCRFTLKQLFRERPFSFVSTLAKRDSLCFHVCLLSMTGSAV